MRFAMLQAPRSLTAQLLALSVGSLLLVMALIAGGTALILALPLASLLQEDLEDHADRVVDSMRFDAQGRLAAVELPDKFLAMYDGLPKDMAYRVAGRDGATLFSSGAGGALDAVRRQPIDGTRRFDRASVESNNLQTMTLPVRRHHKTYLVQVARSERMFSMLQANESETVLMAGGATMALGMVVLCLLVLWTSRRIVKPLREASALAASIAPRNLTTRLDAARLPSELTPLIDAFNSALERLEKGYRVQQEFLASAAHELKTPLAVIRAEVEVGAMPGQEHLLRGVDFMARQVHQLLHLAEVSEARNYVFETLDAASVVSDAASYLFRLAERSDVRIDYLPPSAPVSIEADEGALFILVKNLVENAIQHSPAGGIVTVRVDGNGLAVRNPGPRIAGQDLDKLFVRFWRGSAHEGAGLGLAICDEISMAHGWQLSAGNTAKPPGAEFRVSFVPAAHDARRQTRPNSRPDPAPARPRSGNSSI